MINAIEKRKSRAKQIKSGLEFRQFVALNRIVNVGLIEKVRFD